MSRTKSVEILPFVHSLLIHYRTDNRIRPSNLTCVSPRVSGVRLNFAPRQILPPPPPKCSVTSRDYPSTTTLDNRRSPGRSSSRGDRYRDLVPFRIARRDGGRRRVTSSGHDSCAMIISSEGARF